MFRVLTTALLLLVALNSSSVVSQERKTYLKSVTGARQLTNEEYGYLADLVAGAEQVIREDFNPSLQSKEDIIKHLEAYLSKLKHQSSIKDLEMYTLIFGAYLGDSIVSQYNGYWVSQDDAPWVQIEHNELFNPFAKVGLNIEKGMDESVYEYFMSVGDVTKSKRTNFVFKRIPLKSNGDAKEK